jgi:hypothetical protein
LAKIGCCKELPRPSFRFLSVTIQFRFTWSLDAIADNTNITFLWNRGTCLRSRV